MYRKYIKRLIDVILSLCGLIVLWPFLLLFAFITKLDTPGPVLFKQKRVGKDKTYFYIYKFRSMRVDAPHDVPTHLLSDPSIMMSKWGAFMRKTSIDELPQIINILKGDMSIVGPRPALYNQYDLIEKRDYYHANNIRPGLTGWAQIHGRDELEIDYKAKLDGYYVQHLSFMLDVKCFLMTIGVVAKSEGVVEGGTGSLGDSE
ncbi:MAG: sugar transferase [Erysipelotrichaceae bacterium]|nr:sugar transferase [Erysipelotrichaceae bacterium]